MQQGLFSFIIFLQILMTIEPKFYYFMHNNVGIHQASIPVFNNYQFYRHEKSNNFKN